LAQIWARKSAAQLASETAEGEGGDAQPPKRALTALNLVALGIGGIRSRLPRNRRGLSSYKPVKNFSSIARRADSRVMQAACIATAIDPWILSS
jgi:hypothetical protein